MPIIDRHKVRPMGMFNVSKRLPDHEATKLYRGAEIGFARRSTRKNRNFSYAESDEGDECGDDDEDKDGEDEIEVEDEEGEDEDDYEEEENSPQSDTFCDSDIEEISFEQFKSSVTREVKSRNVESGRVESRKLENYKVEKYKFKKYKVENHRVGNIKAESRKVESRKLEGVDSAAGQLFKQLATEIHQLIAEYLPADCDVAKYALVCKTTGAAITPSVWRKRFQSTFDFDDKFSTSQILAKYKFRRVISRQWTCFGLDQIRGRLTRDIRELQFSNQQHCLELLRTLIVESNARLVQNEHGELNIHGLNLQFIRDMITGDNGMSYVDVLDSVFSTTYDEDLGKNVNRLMRSSDPGALLYNVQLCLTAISLHPEYCNAKVNHFDLSQHQAYSSPSMQPIFLDGQKQSINSRWLLHVVNFFKYHVKCKGEGLLAHAYADLDVDHHPQPWPGRIQAGTQPLGTNWKGAYMYLDVYTLKSCRSWTPDMGIVSPDALDGEETFQDMAFFFDSAEFGNDKWPKQWESILCSDPFKNPESNTRQKWPSSRHTRYHPEKLEKPEIKQFWGTSRGAKTGHFFGRIHAIAPQTDICGFQRLTMILFYTKDEDEEDVYDPDQIWAYEGCVLPGGRIIIGRWWDPTADLSDDTINSGPFIWWNVNRSGATEPICKNDAFDFLNSFRDHNMGVSW